LFSRFGEEVNMAFVKFNKDFDDRLKQMAVRAVKE